MHGGEEAVSLDEADFLLIPSDLEKYVQHYIKTKGPLKYIMLEPAWVDACVKARRALFSNNFGGFRLDGPHTSTAARTKPSVAKVPFIDLTVPPRKTKRERTQPPGVPRATTPHVVLRSNTNLHANTQRIVKRAFSVAPVGRDDESASSDDEDELPLSQLSKRSRLTGRSGRVPYHHRLPFDRRDSFRVYSFIQEVGKGRLPSLKNPRLEAFAATIGRSARAIHKHTESKVYKERTALLPK
ncbi:hypothetical protein DL93DRAFT_2170182 [Clavulina sp. PMI_390]|nr:hypothetical protein DL93DRAFT_2170182 [Clavulina sp. PMI_390]